MVSVYGNVKRPAIYELKDRRDLKNALELAGGLLPRAYNQRLQIERASGFQEQQVLDISYEEMTLKAPIPLQDGDVIQVFSILPEAMNAVYLFGNVLRPGTYAFKPGLRLLDIVPDVESLKKETHFDYALIKRYRREDMAAALIPFDLGRLLLSRDPSQNMALQPLDEIYVFDKFMFEEKHFARVEGEVRNPGRYLIDRMTLRDLMLRAGDVTKEAYLAKGELIRYDEDRRRQTLYFDVAGAMAGDPRQNLMVKHEDLVIIHSIWEEQWKESVQISGEIKKPGDYPITRGMRLKDLFFKAGKFTKNAYLELGHVYRTDWQTKEVTIRTFNVGKALAGKAAHNLALQDLDRVVVHDIYEYVERYNVSIRGMVGKPGDYPYAVNMTVKDLILVAGNIRDAAFTQQAELVRFDIVGGKKVEASVLNFDVLKALEDDAAHNIRLQPLDMVNIKIIPDWWEKKRTVTLRGEVFFPGAYQIRRDERLSDVIARAGGLTEHAYPRGAFFTRESVRVIQRERIGDLVGRLETELATFSSQEAQAALSAEDIASQQQFLAAQRNLIAKLREAKPSGRVVISMASPELLQGSTSDLVLEDGDVLSVPAKPHTVNVLGAVYNPTALIYDESKKELKYYLDMTGGPTENAEKDQMYVIRSDGTVVSREGGSWLGISWSSRQNRWGFWGGFDETPLFPGDSVLVPQKIVRPSFVKEAKDITQILFQLAVTAGVLIEQVF